MKINSINKGAFEQLKTNIQFMPSKNKSKIIMIASGERGEGRSTTAAYLSLELARSGEKTILIDSDLKNPDIHNIFKLDNDKGLLDVLSGGSKYEQVVKPTEQAHLFVLTSGKKSLNYAKLFSSGKFNGFIQSLKERFDYIIIDTPCLNTGLETQVISQDVDGCVLVVKSGQTERKSAQKGKDILQENNVNIIGVFLR